MSSLLLSHLQNLMQTKMKKDEDMTDFLDIPMEGIQEPNELDKYLSQAIERVKDLIAWWWDHRTVYLRLLAMALNYLSIPGNFLKFYCSNICSCCFSYVNCS